LDIVVVKPKKVKHILFKSILLPICGTRDGMIDIVVVIALVHDDR
jgi:hypothetical protein